MGVNVISEDRLQKYLKAAGYDDQRALKLYGWNIQISEAFFPVLSASEVCLRNIISERLLMLYGETWWENESFLTQIDGGKGSVKTARDNLKRKGAVSSGGMTAELNFGFWIKMLLPRHREVFWHDFESAFRDFPDSIPYEDLHQRCDEVREFRNRVFHHEPIFERNLSEEYSKIMSLIS